MILAGEVACFRNNIKAKMSLGKYDDPAALAEYDDWKTVLKLAPKFVKKWLLPILRVISKGVSKDKSPIDILKDIIVQLEKTGKKNKNKNKGNEAEEEEKESSGSGDPENASQEDMNGADEFDIKGPQEW